MHKGLIRKTMKNEDVEVELTYAANAENRK